MIKTFSAHTAEIDDVDAAVSEILKQVSPHKLFAHTIGLVSCYADFISSGALSALAQALPFPLAGTTTIAAASNTVQGEMFFILTVLSSDDVEFAAAVTDPVRCEDAAPFRAAWEKTGALRPEKPALMLSYAPLLNNVASDFFAEAWADITGNVPNFGTLAVDHNQDYHESQTIFNGEAWTDRYVFVLFYGKLAPRFFIAGILEERVFHEKGVITASQGNQLEAVNGVSVTDYLSGLGLMKDENGMIMGINSFPFILDFNDGSRPVVRVMFGVTPEGSAVCGGKVPVGAALMVGTIDDNDVVSTSDTVLKETAKDIQKNGAELVLIFSCIGRFFAQRFNNKEEMKKAQALFTGTPFQFCYAGTELCPVYGKDGSLVNRSHNDTMVICVL